MENEREIKLPLEDLDTLLRNAKLIKTNEGVLEARIESGESVIRIVY